MNNYEITKTTKEKIVTALSAMPIESGGIIGQKCGIICAFEVDPSRQAEDYWAPDIQYLNGVIEEWACEGISFIGLIHTHKNVGFPSVGDTEYAKKILSATGMKEILFPILVPAEMSAPEFYRLTDTSEEFERIDVPVI